MFYQQNKHHVIFDNKHYQTIFDHGRNKQNVPFVSLKSYNKDPNVPRFSHLRYNGPASVPLLFILQTERIEKATRITEKLHEFYAHFCEVISH